MSKLNGLSLFANVGVAETYLDELGIEIKVANELEPKRAKFYSHLYPKTDMVVGDITDDKIKNELGNVYPKFLFDISNLVKKLNTIDF